MIVFITFIIILFIIVYNILIWIRNREQNIANADEISSYGAFREGIKNPFNAIKKLPDQIIKPIKKEIGKITKPITQGFKKIEKLPKELEKPIKKGIDTITKPIKQGLQKIEKLPKELEKPIKKGINTISKPIKQGLQKIEKLPKEIEKPIKKGIDTISKPLKQGLQKIEKLPKELESKIKKIIEKIESPITKIITTIECYFTGIGDIFVAISGYIMCGFEKIKTLPTCFIYYLLDIIYNMCIVLPIKLISIPLPQINGLVNMIYKKMMEIDKTFYDYTTYHIFKYQDSILIRCYRCNNVTPIPNLAERCKKKKLKIDINNSCDYRGISTSTTDGKKGCSSSLKHTEISFPPPEKDKMKTTLETDIYNQKTQSKNNEKETFTTYIQTLSEKDVISREKR